MIDHLNDDQLNLFHSLIQFEINYLLQTARLFLFC